MEMQPVRHFLAQRHLAVLLCVATLLLKLLVPTGYMISGDHGQLAITLCPGVAPAAMTMDMPAMAGDMSGHGPSKDHGTVEMPCAFSGLSAASLGAIDPILVVALIVFILTIGLASSPRPVRSEPRHLRPPLRGPPAYL